MTAKHEGKKNLIGFETVSERFRKIRFKGTFTHITMLSAHAMTTEKDEMEKKWEGNGQRPSGTEEDCTGSPGPQQTIVLEKEEREEQEEEEKDEKEEEEKMIANGRKKP
jgi:hypothetical protein